MVICLDGFEKVKDNVTTEIWCKDKSYVVTDHRKKVIGMVNLDKMSKTDLVGILINEYKDDQQNVNRLKRIIGDPVPRKASGEA